MIREVIEYHANPRQKDGKLWCGHTEADIVISKYGRERILVCGPCSGIPVPKPEPKDGG